MSLKSCKKPVLIKNKFISNIIDTIGITFALSFILPISNFSVYITSYIHEKQDFVTMHYGLFINLIFTISMTLGTSIGGYLELKLGFILTTLIGLLIILITNIFFLNVQNIWFCYTLTLIVGIGVGIANSLGGKNLTLYKPDKKGIIVSVLNAVVILFAGIVSVIGEKLINSDGYTLGEKEEFYSFKYNSRTYLYFILGFFTVPIGTIIFILFSFEYSKNDNLEQIENSETNEKGETEEEKNEISEKPNEINDNKKDQDPLEKDIKAMNKKKNIKKVIKTFRFWRLTLIQFLITFCFSFIVNT